MIITVAECQTCGNNVSCAIYGLKDKPTSVCQACDPDTYQSVANEQKERYLKGGHYLPTPDPLNDPKNW